MPVSINRTKLISKINSTYDAIDTEKTADQLLNCCDDLLINVSEWVNDEPITDIWIKDKYCVGAVLKIRNDYDVIDAILSLNLYAKDDSYETLLWRRRM